MNRVRYPKPPQEWYKTRFCCFCQ